MSLFLVSSGICVLLIDIFVLFFENLSERRK